MHFHTIYIDGVFYENDHGDEAFHEIVPSHEEVIQLNGILKKRLTRLIEKFDLEGEYHEQSEFQVQSVRNRDEKFQLPLKIGKVWDPPFQEFKGTRCSYLDGFNKKGEAIKLRINDRVNGNILRFINHSETPNCNALHIPYTNRWYVVYVSNTHIMPDQELTVDYGDQYWKERD